MPAGLPPVAVEQLKVTVDQLATEQVDTPTVSQNMPPSSPSSRVFRVPIFESLRAARRAWKAMWESGDYGRRTGGKAFPEDTETLADVIRARLSTHMPAAMRLPAPGHNATATLQSKRYSSSADMSQEVPQGKLRFILAELLSKVIIVSMFGAPFLVQFVVLWPFLPSYKSMLHNTMMFVLVSICVSLVVFVWNFFSIRSLPWLMLPCFLCSAIPNIIANTMVFADFADGAATYQGYSESLGGSLTQASAFSYLVYLAWVTDFRHMSRRVMCAFGIEPATGMLPLALILQTHQRPRMAGGRC